MALHLPPQAVQQSDISWSCVFTWRVVAMACVTLALALVTAEGAAAHSLTPAKAKAAFKRDLLRTDPGSNSQTLGAAASRCVRTRGSARHPHGQRCRVTWWVQAFDAEGFQTWQGTAVGRAFYSGQVLRLRYGEFSWKRIY
jgi:hypothetical protein